VDAAGHIVVADSENNALRRVSKAGEVSTLAGNGEEGFADGQGDAVRFNCPEGVELVVNDEIFVSDTYNHVIRVVTAREVTMEYVVANCREVTMEYVVANCRAIRVGCVRSGHGVRGAGCCLRGERWERSLAMAFCG